MTTFERIKETAKNRKMSLVELNNKAGLKENVIYSWKSKTPSADRLKAVADVLNVSVDYLLGETNTPNKRAKVELDDDDVIMTFQGKEVSDEYREIIRKLLKED